MSDSRDLKLKQIVENIENLEDQKREISDQINAVYREADVLSYEVKIIRKIVSMRKKDLNKLREEEDLIEIYKKSLGMVN